MSQSMRLIFAMILVGLAQACVTSSGVDDPPPEEAAQANLNLGVAYLRQGRSDLALDSLRRALEYNPRLGAAHSTIAIVYEQLNDQELAEEHYLRATQLGPDTGAASNSYAVFLCRTDRWRDAERYFRRAADNPRYGTPEVALTNAGVCARGANDLDKAESYLREALMRNRVFPDALYNMADLAFQREDYMVARAFSQRYLGSTTSSAEMLLLCVQIERRLNAPDEAGRCAERLRSGFPNSSEVARLNALERDEQ
jgi:type IV pilus assembly protein PilF